MSLRTSPTILNRTIADGLKAATRGPLGLAVFGARQGFAVVKERRAERSEMLQSLADDAKRHAQAVREHASVLSAPPVHRSRVRRLAPLWIAGLLGGAAIAGAAAWFLRDGTPSATASEPTPQPTPQPEEAPEEHGSEKKDSEAQAEVESTNSEETVDRT